MWFDESMKVEDAWKLMYQVLEGTDFKGVVDPDMQDAIQRVITEICAGFEREEHLEYLRGYEEGERDEKAATKEMIAHYKYERDIAAGIVKRELPGLGSGATVGESRSSKRAKRASHEYQMAQLKP